MDSRKTRITQYARITFAESVCCYVECYVEARKLAARDQRPLRFAGQAWQQMAATGVAARTVSEDLTRALVGPSLGACFESHGSVAAV